MSEELNYHVPMVPHFKITTITDKNRYGITPFICVYFLLSITHLFLLQVFAICKEQPVSSDICDIVIEIPAENNKLSTQHCMTDMKIHSSILKQMQT